MKRHRRIPYEKADRLLNPTEAETKERVRLHKESNGSLAQDYVKVNEDDRRLGKW